MTDSAPISSSAALIAFRLGTLISAFRTQFHFQVSITEAEFVQFSPRDTNGLKERISEVLSEYNNFRSQIPECAETEKLPDLKASCEASMGELDRFLAIKVDGPSKAWQKIMDRFSVLEGLRYDHSDTSFRAEVRIVEALVEERIPHLIIEIERTLSELEHGTKPFFELGLTLTKLRWTQFAFEESEETSDSPSDACTSNAFAEQLSALTSLVRICNELQPQSKLVEYPPIGSGLRDTDLNIWHSWISIKLENSFLRECLSVTVHPNTLPAQIDGPKYYASEEFSTPPDHDQLVTIKQIAEILTRHHNSEGTLKRLHEWKKEGWGPPDGSASGADAWLWGRLRPIVLKQAESKKKGVRAKDLDKSDPKETSAGTATPTDGTP